MRQTTKKNRVQADALLVGGRVKLLRLMAHMTQRELGLLLGMRVEQISLIEAGKRELRVSSLAKMAKALGCKASALVAPLDAEARR